MSRGTRFTELVGCRLPLQLAGMPGVTTPDLVAAVARAGGLAMVGVGGEPTAGLPHQLDEIDARAGDGVWGVNLLVPFLDPAAIEVVAARARVVELFYGDPDADTVARIHAGNALASWQIGSADEARAAVDAGCDLVVAQGTEAGGHVRGDVSLLPLLDGVLDAVDVPVVAAGGIGTARAVAAALAAGADAVRVGTRFVASEESGAHPAYVRALVEAEAGDTVLTDAYSVLWPDAPHRVLRSCLDAAGRLGDGPVAEQAFGDSVLPIPRFSVMLPTRDTIGRIEAMALYAGEGVGSIRRVEPAAEIVRELFPEG